MTDSLRPDTWDGFVGQTALKERLSIHIESAIYRQTRLDHILLDGPPGCGKTTVASIVANEVGSDFESLKCPIEQKVLSRTLRRFRGVLFLDEIHLLTTKVQNDLLMVLADGYLALPSGQRVYTDDLVCIIGATTEREKLLKPLYDRFEIKPTFDEYSDEEMQEITLNMAALTHLKMDPDAAQVLGRAAGGIPRNARSLVITMRDMMFTTADISAADVLKACRVTETGLTDDHQRYLLTLEAIGGVAGLEPLSNHLRLNKAVLMDLERLLVKQELLTYSKAGREMTSEGYAEVKRLLQSRT